MWIYANMSLAANNQIMLDYSGTGSTSVFTRNLKGELVFNINPSLVDMRLYRLCGRMTAHIWLHSGPPLTGISPVVVSLIRDEECEVSPDDMIDYTLAQDIKKVIMNTCIWYIC